MHKGRFLLTGAAGGIGQVVARLLAEAGYSLCLCGRDRIGLEALLLTLPQPQSGQDFRLLVGDLTDAQARAAVVDAAVSAGVDGLINLAGTNALAAFSGQPEAEIEQMVTTNVTATLLLTRALLPHLLQQTQALIVNVGSTLGSIGYPGYATYCATKFALRGFSEALARELGDSRVRVAYFAPRATHTRLNSENAQQMNAELGNGVDSAEVVAAELLKLIRSEKRTAYVGWPEKLFVRINAVLPALVDGNIGQRLPIIKKYLS